MHATSPWNAALNGAEPLSVAELVGYLRETIEPVAADEPAPPVEIDAA